MRNTALTKVAYVGAWFSGSVFAAASHFLPRRDESRRMRAFQEEVTTDYAVAALFIPPIGYVVAGGRLVSFLSHELRCRTFGCPSDDEMK
jgi:hypothetical protein